jgi:hypothetical protein
MSTKTSPGRVAALLQRLVDTYPQRATEVRQILLQSGLKEAEIAKHLKLKLGRPEPTAQAVPLVAADRSRPPSAMLRERFAFAGAMHDIAGHFLSAKEMADLSKKKRFQEIYRAQAQHWSGSAPATVPPERLSVFSVRSLDDGDLTYLVWPEREGGEPALWQYAGQSETRYAHLVDYLNYLCEG